MTETPVVTPLGSLVGSTLGSYQLVRLLGSGGMGHVYEGLHPKIGARVAIKVLLPEVASNPNVVERFFNEARAVNLIGHRNVVKILDMALEGGRYYFVMELLVGHPLTASISPGRPMPFAEAGPILIQCADALQAAHDRGIIHRDVKPDNIFLVNEHGFANFAKLVDFGIAKLAGSGEGVNASVLRTASGVVMGTPAFMSPEQAEGAAEKIDGRSDVYSLGVVMFQLATGRLPFNEPTHVKVMMAHLATRPPLPTSLVPQIPKQVERIILRCLAKEREDRFQSMRELRETLEAALQELALPKSAPRAEPTIEVEVVALEEEPTLASLPPRSASSPAPGLKLGPSIPILGSGLPDEPLPGAEMFEVRPPAPAPKAEVIALRLLRDEPLELDLPGPAAPAGPGSARALLDVDEHDDDEQPARRNLGPLVAIALVFVACAIAVVWFLRGGRNASFDFSSSAAPNALIAPTASARAPLSCPQGTTPLDGPMVELRVASDPDGAQTRVTWAGGGCEVGTTPFKLGVPRGAKVKIHYQLEGKRQVDIEVVADESRLVFESLVQ